MLDTRQVFATIADDWTVPADLPYFSGHFPGRPVFPAVGIVDASLELLRQRTGRSLELVSISSAKFTNPIGPGQRVHIEAKRFAESAWQVDWTESEPAGKRFASLRLVVHE